MKKLLFISCMTLVCATAFSQEFRPFRVGLGLGFASPAGAGAKGGVLLYLEPSYRISDAVVVGLRIEGAAMAQYVTFASANSFRGSFSFNASYSVNGQYYFSNGGFRPFAGAGIGVFAPSQSVSTTNANGTNTSNSGSVYNNKFGFYPRIGFDAGHFVLTIEYNVLGSSVSSYNVSSNGVSTTEKGTAKNNYLGVKFGFFIGGGRK